MPDLDLDTDYDPQDSAETFDETHRSDEMAGSDEDLQDLPDVDADVYDVTSALGDADEEDDDGETADDLDPEDLDDLDDEEDEDEDDDLDDDLEDEPEEDEDEEEEEEPVDAAAGRPAPIEPGLVYAASLDDVTNPRDDDVEKYESTRELSDEQVEDLGYKQSDLYAVKPEGAGADWEERSFGADIADTVIEGSGASADDIEDESDPAEEDRLDEGLEETFPASDPVSAKHIS